MLAKEWQKTHPNYKIIDMNECEPIATPPPKEPGPMRQKYDKFVDKAGTKITNFGKKMDEKYLTPAAQGIGAAARWTGDKAASGARGVATVAKGAADVTVGAVKGTEKGLTTVGASMIPGIARFDELWAEVRNTDGDCNKPNMTEDQLEELGWACIKPESIKRMKAATFLLGLFILLNIIMGFIIVVLMMVDAGKKSSNPYPLNKNDPAYKTVIGIGQTSPSKYAFMDPSNLGYKKLKKGYPFIIIQAVSAVIIVFSALMFARTLPLQGGNKVKLFYGLIFFYCLICGLINLTYTSTKMLNARRDEYSKYEEFNDQVRDYMRIEPTDHLADFLTALSKPSSGNRGDTVLNALRELDNDNVDANGNQVAGSSKSMDPESLSQVLVVIALYTYYDNIDVYSDREEALAALFNSVSYMDSLLLSDDKLSYKKPAMEYTKHLYSTRIEIDDSVLEGYIKAAKTATPPIPTISNSIDCNLSKALALAKEKITRLNDIYASFGSQEVFHEMRTMANALFLAQLAIPVIMFVAWRFLRDNVSAPVKDAVLNTFKDALKSAKDAAGLSNRL